MLLYAVDQTKTRKNHVARRLLERLWRARRGYISIQVLQGFYWNATRKLSSPLDAATARQVVEDYGK